MSLIDTNSKNASRQQGCFASSIFQSVHVYPLWNTAPIPSLLRLQVLQTHLSPIPAFCIIAYQNRFLK